jgi:hypothetical protein
MKSMRTVNKGQPKTPENKSQIPTGSVVPLQKVATAQPNLTRPMGGQNPTYAQGMAQSGVGAPAKQFDPALAMQMLKGRA